MKCSNPFFYVFLQKVVPENILEKLKGDDVQKLIQKLNIQEPRQRGFGKYLKDFFLCITF